MKKKLLIFSSIGLLIILSAIVFLRISQNTPKLIPKDDLKVVDQAPDNQDSGQISQAKAREIAGKILNWADTMKNDKGQYLTLESCMDGQCRKEGLDKQAGILVVWARYKLYEKTQDPELLQKISEDLDVLTTPDIGSPAQNDMLNCSLMHEMHSSNLFSEEMKGKIFRICNESIFYGDAMKDFVNLYKNKIVINEPDIDRVLAGKRVKGQSEAVAQYFDNYSNYATDLADAASWIPKPDTLLEAKFFFNLALELYSKREPNIIEAAIGPASIRLFQATREDKYINFAQNYIEKKKNNTLCFSISDCAYFSHFLSIFFHETNDLAVQETSLMVFNYLKEASYDNEKGLYRNIGNINKKFYNLVPNMLIAGALTTIK